MKITIVFVAGVLLGLTVAIVFGGAWKAKPREYVLTSDLDLATSYFFAPDAPQARGTLKAGTVVELQGQHSTADYILVRTVIAHEKFVKIARAVTSAELRSK